MNPGNSKTGAKAVALRVNPGKEGGTRGGGGGLWGRIPDEEGPQPSFPSSPSLPKSPSMLFFRKLITKNVKI